MLAKLMMMPHNRLSYEQDNELWLCGYQAGQVVYACWHRSMDAAIDRAWRNYYSRFGWRSALPLLKDDDEDTAEIFVTI